MFGLTIENPLALPERFGHLLQDGIGIGGRGSNCGAVGGIRGEARRGAGGDLKNECRVGRREPILVFYT